MNKCFIFSDTKDDILKNVGGNSMGSQWLPSTVWLPIFSEYIFIQQNTGLEQHEGD